ncbi:MAG: OsmC family protein [Nitrososphaerota archaeon]|nr:OsmC family protein [Candidatus Calditenuaceae archaeon]MDW8072734.1 OsmC family protein [Nitrososphaerota archaeon]
MPKLNNIEMEKVSETLESISRDSSMAKRVTKIEGAWVFEGDVQFIGELRFEAGSVRLEMSLPTFLGGSGRRPGPIHYCLYGLASCFASTIASIAAEKNVTLRSLKLEAECHLDFSKPLGVADKPILDAVKFLVKIDAEADDERVKQILVEAEKRCPAVYALTNSVPVQVLLK